MKAIKFGLGLGLLLVQGAAGQGAGPNVVLKPADMQVLQQALQGSALSLRQTDGSSHPLVDGVQLMEFLNQHRDLAPKADETMHSGDSEAPVPLPSPSPTYDPPRHPNAPKRPPELVLPPSPK